jgi:hypothetical protein
MSRSFPSTFMVAMVLRQDDTHGHKIAFALPPSPRDRLSSATRPVLLAKLVGCTLCS